MCSIVCLFVFFIFSHGVVRIFSIYVFDCPSGIFRSSLLRNYNPLPFHECDLPNSTIYRICNHISNTTGATCGAGSAYPSGAPEITLSFWWGSCCLFFSFLCCSCVLLVVYLSFSFIAMALSVYFRFMSLTVPLLSKELGL